MLPEFDKLNKDVQANTDAKGSVVAMIKGFAAKVEASKADPVALSAFAKSLTDDASAWADSVVQNTTPDTAPKADYSGGGQGGRGGTGGGRFGRNRY